LSSLYLEHFGLNEAPFGITPNGRFFFAGQTRGTTLDALQHAVMDEDGIIVVIGEVGSGKTMLCRMLADRLQGAAVDLVYLSNPSFGPREILASFVADWGLKVPAGQPTVLSIQAALMERHDQGRRVVVLIDEAQSMPPDSLQEIKLLSNLETAQHKLMQIVLFGQPELNELLALPRLRQVRDRVVHRFELQPLSDDDAVTYIAHRLRRAGWRGARLFQQKALKQLVTAAAGRMRAIHLLADKSLLAAYADGAYEVLPMHVKRAQADLMLGGDVHRSPASLLSTSLAVRWAAVAVATLALGVGLGWYLSQSLANTSNNASVMTAEEAPPSVAAPSSPSLPLPVPPHPPAPETTRPQPSPSSDSTALTPAPATTETVNDKPAMPDTRQRYAGLPADLQQWVERSRVFLDDPALQGWTVQIGFARDVTNLRYLLAQVKDLSPVWFHDRHYAKPNTAKGTQGLGTVWSVYVGRYDSRHQANEAIRRLPLVLQNARPLIRTFGGIRSEPYPERPPL
jgi:type II secretory pathway predicted ATPase ExeA